MTTSNQARAGRGVDYPRVSCAFFCHDGNGRFVLHRRGPECRDEQGVWDSGAGALEHGESFEQAVAREVREEYCATAYDTELVGVRNIIRTDRDEPTHWVALIFTVRVDPDEVRIGEPHKMSELGWFTEDDLPGPLHPALPPQLQIYREKGTL